MATSTINIIIICTTLVVLVLGERYIEYKGNKEIRKDNLKFYKKMQNDEQGEKTWRN